MNTSKLMPVAFSHENEQKSGAGGSAPDNLSS